jgi:hypothetical protein
MELYHYQERLDNWVQYTTSRTVKNFTELGFAVVDGPPELYARLKKRLHDAMESGGARLEMSGKPQGIYGDNVPEFVNHGNENLLLTSFYLLKLSTTIVHLIPSSTIPRHMYLGDHNR